VCHEGIDLDRLGPDPHATVTTPSGLTLRHGDPVITYVARNLEPYRGFHVFMRALERIQRLHPRCHALIVGGDEVSYGKRPSDATNWRDKMLAEVRLDPQRTHFLGKVPYARYLEVLRVSAAHVYLTYPFVLSWSLLEAMACGVPIVASDTAPVREVVRDGTNGALVPFGDAERVANAALSALESQATGVLAAQARREVRRFSLQHGFEGYSRLIAGAADSSTVEPGGVRLTRAEQHLLQLLAAGRSNDEIAALRRRSAATIRNQLSSLYQKLGVTRRVEAVAKAARLKDLMQS
jgi:glycosyltransferase involved in cell wall biosynthesis/DNA-binding CsgD family transcriptional regulator